MANGRNALSLRPAARDEGLSPDPWDKKPPDLHELSDDELLEFLGVAARNGGCFNDFELSFCASISRQILRGYPLSEKQIAVLDKRGLLKKLWDNDPILWRE
jgi:hypothetical protein